MMTATALMTGAVRAEIRGNIGVITLNRAKALNALTTAMVEAIDAVLREWATTGLHAVVLDSASPRASAPAATSAPSGRTAWPATRNRASGSSTEYDLNARIATYPVPFISLIDGICMGGGMGLSVHGTFRVVSDNVTLSMPETGIGFFPDIGASHFLSRLPGALGTGEPRPSPGAGRARGAVSRLRGEGERLRARGRPGRRG
jgi:enoyl-CoA hydratase/carnithine racemase